MILDTGFFFIFVVFVNFELGEYSPNAPLHCAFFTKSRFLSFPLEVFLAIIIH